MLLFFHILILVRKNQEDPSHFCKFVFNDNKAVRFSYTSQCFNNKTGINQSILVKFPRDNQHYSYQGMVCVLVGFCCCCCCFCKKVRSCTSTDLPISSISPSGIHQQGRIQNGLEIWFPDEALMNGISFMQFMGLVPILKFPSPELTATQYMRASLI